MGNTTSKIDFHTAVAEMISSGNVSSSEKFWNHYTLSPTTFTIKEIFANFNGIDIRKLRDESPSNFSSIVYKAINVITKDTQNISINDHKKILNSIHFLTRIIPFMYECDEWKNFFWTYENETEPSQKPKTIASNLVTALSNLLFVIDFTVKKVNDEECNNIGKPVLDTCEYIWEAGVGFTNKMGINGYHDENRVSILRLLLVCFSEFLYLESTDKNRMRWITSFTSAENKHVLPIFTSLLNIICAYDPSGLGVPYNYLLLSDSREPLVSASLQLLLVSLDNDSSIKDDETGYTDNLFIQYLSRIHREDDFAFMLRGITTLLNNPLQTTYLPNSVKKVNFYQELLVLLWKCCEYNQKFMYYVLKTSDILEILVPILYYINEARTDPAKVSFIHMGIFLILLLSGERNFGVRLNKPYISKLWMDLPSFNGTHADLLIIVFHKLITAGNHRLQGLFDCLLTIIVNVSPYLKSLSMVAANKLLHLTEAFTTPWFLFSSPNNYTLVFLLLDVFNNIIQYQFDGNSNLIYTLIRKRQVFYEFANISSDSVFIKKNIEKKRIKDEKKKAEEKNKETCNTELLINIMSDIERPTKISSENDNKDEEWIPTTEWVDSWKSKIPLQTINRLLQVLVPQVEKICIDKGLTDEKEILKFLQNGTLVGLLPVPHPIVIRKYQANAGTKNWFRTYMWGIIFLLNNDPPICYAFLGMNRCVAIRYYGTKAKFFNRVSIAIISSILTWLIGIITAYFGTFPEPLIGLRSELWSITFKDNINNKRSKFFFYIIVFLNIISLLTQWICSILVLLKIRLVKQKINKNKLNQSSANRFKKQARLTFQFFYPSLLCTISSILFLSKPFLYGIFSNWHLIILHLIWIINHLCNPFIYSYFNERMRFSYREIYHCSYIQYLIQKRKRFTTMGWTGRSNRYVGKSTRNSIKSCRSTRDGNFVRNSLQMQSRDFEQLCEFMMRVNPLYDSSEGWQECSDEENSIDEKEIKNCKKKKKKSELTKKDDFKELQNTGVENRSIVLHLGRDTVEQWVRFAKKASI
uniref:HID1 domain-containing protein n=1 Tax=Strongyloides stercoralis TaxID=6248 RepID=A0AAF5DNA0_STRER